MSDNQQHLSNPPSNCQNNQSENHRPQTRLFRKSYKKMSINDSISNSIQKQSKLTHYWKGQQQQSVSSSKRISQKQQQCVILEQVILAKNKMIEKLKSQKDGIEKKLVKLSLEKQSYQSKAMEIIKISLKEMEEVKRKERGNIISDFGYFKDNVFIQGPFTKQLRIQINNKKEQISCLKTQSTVKKQQNKDQLKFKQKFLLKEIDQLNVKLKEREKKINIYKDELKFAEKEKKCMYSKKNWEVINNKYLPLCLLGSGGFGEVYKCYDLEENHIVALKETNISISKNEEQKADFMKHMKRQIKILKSLNHPNIAKLIEVISITSASASFVMEYCSGPELSKYLKKNESLEEKQAKEIIRQIVFALKYLYEESNKIIHYDLKPSNIMFHQGVVKIVDFGLCKKIDSEDSKIDLTSQGVGTYWYLPPETFRDYDNQVCSKVDVWSMGVIFYELLYGKRPFGHGMSQVKIFSEGIILKEALKLSFPEHTPLRYKVSEGAKKFIKDCLKYDQNERLNPLQCYNHQYFK